MIRILYRYVSIKTILLMLIEGALIFLLFLWGVKLRWNDPVGFSLDAMVPGSIGQALILVLIFEVCFYYNDLYDLNVVRRWNALLSRLVQSVGAGCLLLGLLYFPPLLIGRKIFLVTMVLVVGSVVLTRVAIDAAWQAAPLERVLIVGTGGLADALARELAERRDLNFRLIGFVGKLNGASNCDHVSPRSILGSTGELESLALRHRIARIIVAMEDHREALPIGDLLKLKMRGVRVEDVHSAMAALTGRVWLNTVRPSWFIFSDGFRRSAVTVGLKRALDLCLALIGLILSAPIMALVAILVRLDSEGPVLYRQVRVGRAGSCFELLKFRSMTVDAEEENGAQWAQEDDPRITRLGHFIRKFRLDELPQFINVIRGDMSFVGPRPERPVFVEMLRQQIPYYDERHSLRPGITGWAQVEYGYGSSVEGAFRKLEYDLFYLKNMSFLFDCAIVIQTVRIVLFGRGSR